MNPIIGIVCIAVLFALVVALVILYTLAAARIRELENAIAVRDDKLNRIREKTVSEIADIDRQLARAT